MENCVDLRLTYLPSENIVARIIEDELIIVPLTSGFGNMEDELYTLNETGRAIWEKLDGRKSLQVIADELSIEFNSSIEEVQSDVAGFAQELLGRKILVEC